MIRINTQTDLRADQPMAFYSPASAAPTSTPKPRPAGTSPSKPRPTSNSSPSKAAAGGPSASLRVQHSEAWMSQFVLPLANNDEHAAQLEEMGRRKVFSDQGTTLGRERGGRRSPCDGCQRPRTLLRCVIQSNRRWLPFRRSRMSWSCR